MLLLPLLGIKIAMLYICLHHQICGGVEAVVALDSGTYRVVFGYLPVEPQVIVNPIVLEMISRMRFLDNAFDSTVGRQIV